MTLWLAATYFIAALFIDHGRIFHSWYGLLAMGAFLLLGDIAVDVAQLAKQGRSREDARRGGSL